MSGWVFGYGSLVAPASVGQTIGREPQRGTDLAAARLAGFGRRWNYGSLRQRADWSGPVGRVSAGVVVSLGIAASSDESANGAIVRVDDAELERLDLRESDYERIDVTAHVELHDELRCDGVVWTYLPRPSAIERYETAAATGRAAVRLGYVELVEAAFAAMGADHLDSYRTTTPTPEVPVLTFESHWLEPRSTL